MGNEDQALIVHSKKTKRNHHRSKGKISHPKRDLSTITCYIKIVAQEEKMGSEDQALIVHFKKTKRSHHHSKGKISHYRKDLTTIRCYTCDEKGHISRFFPNKGNLKKKKETREDIMLMLQRMMNLPQRELDKKVILQEMKNMC